MNQPIKSLVFKGELEVWGVYNYNKIWSVLKKNNRGFYDKHRDNNKTNYTFNNHIYAKTFIDKDKNKEVDYTSSRCLRHEIFKDLQPRQPSKKDFNDQFIKMAASEIGLLRGYLSPDEGFKRCSPLYVADARTIGEVEIVYDQGTSSKPKEGEEKSDTSIFSKDNAPYRKQKLEGGVNLKELQFLSLYGVDNDFSMISKQNEDNFLKLLKAYFKKHNVDDRFEVKKYVDIEAIYRVERDGILLNQEQIRHLVKVIFQRIKMINGLKAGARLAYKKDSLEVSFFDGEDTSEANETNLKNKLDDLKFYPFFKEV